MEIIKKYFPKLKPHQNEQLAALKPLYTIWNNQINVISRKDMDNFYLHHVLHSMAIAKFIQFTEGTNIIDVGTGGGFPGIPLSILFPETKFTLLDSVGKKLKVIEAIKNELDLSNITTIHSRSEDFRGNYDFIISRAVSKFPEFVKRTRHLISKHPQNAIPNGILYLKGGDLTNETKPYKNKVFISNLNGWFTEPFFETKKLIHLPL
ncbi:MAG: 16S rRNA (guanine(527)-N(7))-methyltransferase RsmG [bacterium]